MAKNSQWNTIIYLCSKQFLLLIAFYQVRLVHLRSKTISSTHLSEHVGKMKFVGIIVENVDESSDKTRSCFWTAPCLVACRTTCRIHYQYGLLWCFKTSAVKCAEWWREMENKATTSCGYCSSTVSLPVRSHCTNHRMSDKSDAKQILTASPLDN